MKRGIAGMSYNILKNRLYNLVQNKKKFIIYPMGQYGAMVKGILNGQMGIQESYIIDNGLCHMCDWIYPVSILEKLHCEDYLVLIACKDIYYSREIIDSLKSYQIEYCNLFHVEEQDLNTEEQIFDEIKEGRFKSVIESKLNLEKFIIYPYGKWGKYAEQILIENNIEDYWILDKEFSKTEGRKLAIDDIKSKKDCYVLLCCDNKAIYGELRNHIGTVVDSRRIIDVCYYGSTYRNSEPRLAILESCAKEIYNNCVEGCTAEAGVYRGDFARYINELFPDKELYLFDTYEGFPQMDSAYDKINSFSEGNQDWSETNVELVLNKMSYKDKCIVRKGFFPDTAKDIDMDQKFCFVSLDMDLYQPTYAGLKFFYPRMAKGGYIFVHDCRNIGYMGARQALLDFCGENGIGYTLLTDEWGSAVIAK